jgi:hypothetical protein
MRTMGHPDEADEADEANEAKADVTDGAIVAD